MGSEISPCLNAAGEQVGAQHLAALGLHAKAASTRAGALVCQVGTTLLLETVAHAVKARQVGERLSGADDVVRGDGSVQMRQVDLDQLRALGLQLRGSFLDCPDPRPP